MKRDIRKLIKKYIPILACLGALTLTILLDEFFINITISDGERIIIALLFFLHFLEKQATGENTE